MNIIQIGCNKAHDSCHKYITEHKDEIENVYLIEALPSCIPVIEKAYRNIPNVKIFNMGIGITSEEELEFFYPTKDPKSGHSSFNKGHLLSLGHKSISSIKIPCMTLNDFFIKENIEKCDRLYIDAEGLDCKILCSFDVEKYKIPYIEYESYNCDGTATRGATYNSCAQKLKNMGYTSVRSGLLNDISTLKLD
jgi:FkbM family methyltransferase